MAGAEYGPAGAAAMNRVGTSALITGGGSGIGLACAEAFAREGAAVLLFGRSESRLQEGADHIRNVVPKAQVLTCTGDVTVETQLQAAVSQANSVAPLTVALANAGMGGLAPLAATDVASYDQIMAVNARGTLLTFKHAGEVIAANGGGALCAISSIAGVRTHRFMAAYTMSKAAIDMLVRNAADELGARQVRVNSVCPGLVETELAGALLQTPAILQDYIECMPLARHGQASDIANAVEFLCGDSAGWITGVNLSVDGGHHLRRGPSLEPFIAAASADD